MEKIEGEVEWWTFDAVQERLIEAMGFLDRVTPSGYNPYAGDGPWSQIVRDRLVDYVDVDDLRERGAKERGGLRAAEVDRMTVTLDWIGYVPAKGNLRKLVGVVILQLLNGGSQPRWADVKAQLRSRQSTEVLRKSYGKAILTIAERLNANHFSGSTASSPTIRAA